MATTPKFDPAELEAADLTEAEAEDIREGLAEIDRGEVMPGREVLAELLSELEDLSRVRRAG